MTCTVSEAVLAELVTVDIRTECNFPYSAISNLSPFCTTPTTTSIDHRQALGETPLPDHLANFNYDKAKTKCSVIQLSFRRGWHNLFSRSLLTNFR